MASSALPQGGASVQENGISSPKREGSLAHDSSFPKRRLRRAASGTMLLALTLASTTAVVFLIMICRDAISKSEKTSSRALAYRGKKPMCTWEGSAIGNLGEKEIPEPTYAEVGPVSSGGPGPSGGGGPGSSTYALLGFPKEGPKKTGPEEENVYATLPGGGAGGGASGPSRGRHRHPAGGHSEEGEGKAHRGPAHVPGEPVVHLRPAVRNGNPDNPPPLPPRNERKKPGPRGGDGRPPKELIAELQQKLNISPGSKTKEKK